MLRIRGALVTMYTRRKRKRDQDAATSRAARVVQRLWRRKDPLLFKVVRKPFWIFRGASAYCFDANALYDYVAAESDSADVFTRQPYTRAELFALAFVANMPHLSFQDLVARRADVEARRQIVVAMETEVEAAVSQIANVVSPDDEDGSSRKLLEALGDLVVHSGLEHAGFIVKHAVDKHRRGMDPVRFRYLVAEVRTLCVFALFRNQI